MSFASALAFATSFATAFAFATSGWGSLSLTFSNGDILKVGAIECPVHYSVWVEPNRSALVLGHASLCRPTQERSARIKYGRTCYG